MITNSINTKSPLMVAFGDTHIGNINTDINALKSCISFVKKTGANLIGLGDWAEAITSNDPRFNLSQIDPQFLNGDLIANQYEYIEDLLYPVAHQIIGLHEGNHDDKLGNKFHYNLTKRLCRNLDVPYLEWSAFTRLNYKRAGRSTNFTIYSTHGSSSGTLKGAKVNSMEKLSNFYEADLYLMGHTHDLFTTSTALHYMSATNQIYTKYRHYGNTGTFLRGVTEGTTSYAERSNYAPNRIGYLLYTFDPETHTIKGQEVIC